MSSKIILPIVLLILVVLVGVGVYASIANLNPLKEKSNSISVSSLSQSPIASKVRSSNLQLSSPSLTISSKLVEKIPTSISEFKEVATAINTDPAPVAISNIFTLSDLESHSTEKSCYVSVAKKVYDVTKYIGDHPGGEKNILKGCGRVLDGMKHPGGGFMGDQVQSVLSEYKIGELQ